MGEFSYHLILQRCRSSFYFFKLRNTCADVYWVPMRNIVCWLHSKFGKTEKHMLLSSDSLILFYARNTIRIWRLQQREHTIIINRCVGIQSEWVTVEKRKRIFAICIEFWWNFDLSTQKTHTLKHKNRMGVCTWLRVTIFRFHISFIHLKFGVVFHRQSNEYKC